jgi:hypothetical protein
VFIFGPRIYEGRRMTKANSAPSEDVADVTDTFIPDPQVWKRAWHLVHDRMALAT